MGRVIMSGIVPLLSKPVKGKPLSKLDEGTIIKINEGGSPAEFYLAKHNYEPDLNGIGRELVVRKDCVFNLEWNNNDRNGYATSTLDAYINTKANYLSRYTEGVITLIGTTKFPYTISANTPTVDILERAVFLLSGTEVGSTRSDIFNVEGSVLPIASTLFSLPGSTTYNIWWLRSPNINNYIQAGRIVKPTSGDSYAEASRVTNTSAVRPCFTLPSTAKVDDTGLLIG